MSVGLGDHITGVLLEDHGISCLGYLGWAVSQHLCFQVCGGIDGVCSSGDSSNAGRSLDKLEAWLSEGRLPPPCRASSLGQLYLGSAVPPM